MLWKNNQISVIIDLESIKLLELHNLKYLAFDLFAEQDLKSHLEFRVCTLFDEMERGLSNKYAYDLTEKVKSTPPPQIIDMMYGWGFVSSKLFLSLILNRFF